MSTALKNPFRYRGYYYDNETGFYYLQSRYYDPVVGRFINADDTDFLGFSGTVVSYNLYAYCENDPIKHKDPKGQGLLLAMAIGFVAGAIVSGIFKVVENRKKGKKWYDGLAISMLAGGVGGAISCITIPGVNTWVCAAVFGAAGNLVTEVILGEIDSLDDLVSAIRAGVIGGLIGNAAANLLTKGLERYFGSLIKSAQKAFLSRVGQITSRQLTAIRQTIKKGMTPSILNELVEKYGWDVIVSSIVSSTYTSAA